MRNAIAEWMLSQVALPARAKTVVGDLLEAQPGPLEFWRSVLQAAASIALRDPRQFLVKLTGFVIQFGVWAVFAWAISVVSPHRFLAVYGVFVGLFLLWGWVTRLITRTVIGWWMRWRRRQKNGLPENDRPVAG